MKKILLMLVVCVMGIIAHANTCTYDGVNITLRTEQVTVPEGTRYVYGEAYLQFSSDKPITSPRVQVRVYDSNNNLVNDEFITLKNNGSRQFYYNMKLPAGRYTFKLVARNSCY